MYVCMYVNLCVCVCMYAFTYVSLRVCQFVRLSICVSVKDGTYAGLPWRLNLTWRGVARPALHWTVSHQFLT